jgi:hypothetical protein
VSAATGRTNLNQRIAVFLQVILLVATVATTIFVYRHVLLLNLTF